jgi:hypothetical protein
MNALKSCRRLTLAMLVFGAIAWTSHDARAAEHLLLALGNISNGNCTDPSGNLFFMEGWGYDSSGTIVCETSVGAGSAGISEQFLGDCTALGTGVTHTAVITIRNSNTWAYVNVLIQSATAPWSTGIATSYNVANGPNCQGGATIIAESVGFDTTT